MDLSQTSQSSEEEINEKQGNNNNNNKKSFGSLFCGLKDKKKKELEEKLSKVYEE